MMHDVLKLTKQAIKQRNHQRKREGTALIGTRNWPFIYLRPLYLSFYLFIFSSPSLSPSYSYIM